MAVRRVCRKYPSLVNVSEPITMFIRLIPLLLMAVNAPAQQIVWIDNPVNGHRYGVGLSATTWADGEALAVTQGGHLATIRNASEQAWIEANFASYNTGSGLWIGFNDVEVEGQWVWVSGEPVTYTNWAPGEPNNSSGNEHYGHLFAPTGPYPWRWNDHPGAIPNTRPLIEITPPGNVRRAPQRRRRQPARGVPRLRRLRHRPAERDLDVRRHVVGQAVHVGQPGRALRPRDGSRQCAWRDGVVRWP
jgi:hypothetical protein